MNLVKRSLLNFFGTAKAAGQLAAAQSKKTKLSTIDLPASYLVLGRLVLQSGHYTEQFLSEHEQIKKLDEQIAKYNERTEAEGSDLKHKMKAGADNVKKAGMLKATQVRRDSVLKTLGKNAYAAQLNDPEFAGAFKTIADVNSKVAFNDAEINRLSEIDKGEFITPKRMLIGASALAVIWLIGMVIGPSTERSANTGSEQIASAKDGPDTGLTMSSTTSTGKSSARSAESLWPDLILSEHQTPSRIGNTSKYKTGYNEGVSFGAKLAQQYNLMGLGMGRYGILDHISDLSILDNDPILETVEFKIGYADGMEYGLGKRFWPEMDKEDFRWELRNSK